MLVPMLYGVLHLGEWLLPFLAVSAISAIIAAAVTVAVDRDWASPPLAPGPDASAPVVVEVVPEGQDWVEIRAIMTDATSMSLRCVAKPGIATENDSVIMVPPSDFGAIAEHVCAHG